MNADLRKQFDRFLALDMPERAHVFAHLVGWLEASAQTHDISNTLAGIDSALTASEARQRVSPAMGTRQTGEKKE